jgi:hypothetical protein
LFTGHDYRPEGREPRWQSSVAEQKAHNTHLTAYRDKAAFVEARQKRDKTLPIPKLMLHALQVNCAAGNLPQAEDNGRRYLKIPLGLFDAPWGRA